MGLVVRRAQPFPALHTNKKLESLSLAGNNLGPMGAAAFAKVFGPASAPNPMAMAGGLQGAAMGAAAGAMGGVMGGAKGALGGMAGSAMGGLSGF